MKTSRYLCMVASAIMLAGIVSAAPAMAVSGSPDAHSIIKAKTGSDAVEVTDAQSVNGVSLGVGYDKSGKALPSFAQTTTTGVRMMAVFDGSSQTEASFALGVPDGAKAVLMPDGGMVVVTDPDGPKAIPDALGSISPPWAVDANGASLPTAYSYKDGVLTQNVDTTGAVLPVVLDPQLNFGWGIYFSLFGFEIKAIISVIIGGVGGSLIAACYTSNLPVVVGRIVRILCTIFGGPSVLSVLSAITSSWRNRTINNTWCYQKEITPNIGGWVAVSTSNCRVY